MESLLDLTLPAWSITSAFHWERQQKCGSSGESGISCRMQECTCEPRQKSNSPGFLKGNGSTFGLIVAGIDCNRPLKCWCGPTKSLQNLACSFLANSDDTDRE